MDIRLKLKVEISKSVMVRAVTVGLEDVISRSFIKKYAAEKGEGIMRIAVTYENGQIFQHFGHTETFKIYDVEEGKVVHSEVVDTNVSGHGALAGCLNALSADVLICGGIGGGAQTALAAKQELSFSEEFQEMRIKR